MAGLKKVVLTDKQIEDVEKLAGVLNTAQLADFLGIARSTFFKILEREPEINKIYKAARAETISKISSSLVSKALSGDMSASIFFLKTQAGWKETQVIEDGGKVKTFADMYKDDKDEE